MAVPHRALIDLAAGRKMSGIPSDANLREFVRSALEHHMFGLVWTQVRAGRLELPVDLENQMAVQDLMVQERHRRLWKTIARVDDELTELGIDAVVLKGVPVEARWYSRLGERPCADVDLWIGPDDVGQLHEIVKALAPTRQVRPTMLAEYKRGLVSSLDLQVDGAVVDLHLDPLKVALLGRNRRGLWDHANLWKPPGELPIAERVRMLSPEATLFHLLVILNKDGFYRLLGYADVARIVQDETIDWIKWQELARSYGLEDVARSTLAAVADTLGLHRPIATPTGWRAIGWRWVWPPEMRLQGDLGRAHYRRRSQLVPLLADQRVVEAALWWSRRILLTPSLVLDTHSNIRGPWWWRLAVGRSRRWRQRRLVRRALT